MNKSTAPYPEDGCKLEFSMRRSCDETKSFPACESGSGDDLTLSEGYTSGCEEGKISSIIKTVSKGDNLIATVENPLSYIDPKADLNLVANQKNLADAVKILCPNLPELLPYLDRTKYIRKGTLTSEAKVALGKERNRANAHRARERKRYYAYFVADAILAIEEQQSKKMSSAASAEVNSALLQRSLQLAKVTKFLHLIHLSHIGSISHWIEICSDVATHTGPVRYTDQSPSEPPAAGAPVPKVKSLSILQNHVFENSKLLDEILLRDGLIVSHVWRTSIVVDQAGAMFEDSKLMMSVEYVLTVQLVPYKMVQRKTSSRTVGADTIHIPAMLTAQFNESGLIDSVEEFYDVDVLRGLIVAAIGPDVTPKETSLLTTADALV